VSFRRRQNHDLKGILKKLGTESLEAIEVLVTLLKSTDDRIKLSAATKLIDAHVQVSNIVNDDAFKRVLAEAKYPTPGELTTEEEDDTPQINFEEIQDCE
jgi:hypothetical protein